MKCLFIGGPRDGERIEVSPLLAKLYVPVNSPPTAFATGEEEVSEIRMRCVEYERQDYAAGEERYVIYSAIPPSEAFRALVDGYMPKREEAAGFLFTLEKFCDACLNYPEPEKSWRIEGKIISQVIEFFHQRKLRRLRP